MMVLYLCLSGDTKGIVLNFYLSEKKDTLCTGNDARFVSPRIGRGNGSVLLPISHKI
jgi:hypothetical protein